MVLDARDNQESLSKLLKHYWGPVYAYLRRDGRDREQAEEFTQAFLAEVLIGRELLLKVNPARGRFRSFLLKSLKHYLVDVHRHQHGRDGQRTFISLPDDPDAFRTIEPDERDGPDQAFLKQWAATVFGQALERMRDSCLANGMEHHWQVFEARSIQPLLYGREPASLDELVVMTSAQDTSHISNLLHSAKRKFYGILQEVVSETVDDPDTVESEIDELIRLLGAPS
ncbi:MAG: hypothetical protein O7G85_09300 [Planctomycetota bacterium]|nr:hypothetical protein [Planctomycetota bacterium]